MSPAARSLSVTETAALTRRVTLLSVAVAAVLIVIKAIAWKASGSVALLASLADSSIDLVASLITFFAVRYAVTPPDAEHRFGHGKAEAFASLIQGGLVFLSAGLIGREAIGRLLHPQPVAAEGAAMAVMAVSLVLTGGLIFAQSRVLRATGSVAVSGDRAHYAADVASNLVALIAIGAAALTRQTWIDAVAGLVIAGWLVWGAIAVFREASNQLMDRELPDEDRDRILKLLTLEPGVLGAHSLRTRASGAYVFIQAHIDLDPAQSLESAHRLLIAAENRVLQAFPAADILLHADPRGRAEPHGGAFGETALSTTQ